MRASALGRLLHRAALNDDRDNAHTLLHEAEVAHSQAPAGGEHFTALDFSVYKISVTQTLGDLGAAVKYARLIDPSPERRARYWEDTALALHG